MAPFAPKIQTLRELQRAFQQHTGVPRLLGAGRRLARHLPHSRARAASSSPATSSRRPTATPAWAARSNALAYGVGATEYAALCTTGFTFVEVPESIRFELHGELPPGVTAKDVMLHILANHAKRSRRSTA